MPSQTTDYDWYDAGELPIHDRGWQDGIGGFHRLPDRAERTVRPAVWQRACSPAGLFVQFSAATTDIRARWTPAPADGAGLPAMTIRNCGLDCYGQREDGRWCWVGVGQPGEGISHEARLNDGPLDPSPRAYRVYLPLGVRVGRLEIGLPRGTRLEPTGFGARPPIVIYGTSIVQGAGVSRPGLAYPSIISRRLDYPVVNLGFASNGTMDESVAALMAELDAAVFVIDCLPNMDPEGVTQRLPRVVEVLRAAHATTPILLVGDRLFGDGAFVIGRREKQAANSAAQRAVYEQLKQAGDANLHLLDERNFFGDDFEGSTDTVHPNDIGAMRVADAVEGAVVKVHPESVGGGA